MRTSSYENFPWWMIAVCNAVNLAIYAIGIYLTSRLGIVWGILYVAYCGWVEWKVLSRSCRHCYYFGKRCGFGKGRVCAWFFSKPAEKNLCEKQISWRNVLPDFLVSLIPLAVGIALLIHSFSWLVLLLAAALLLLCFAGTGFVRGQIACKYCKQRELGCPAEQLFSKRQQA
jgi:hypothetical protein